MKSKTAEMTLTHQFKISIQNTEKRKYLKNNNAMLIRATTKPPLLTLNYFDHFKLLPFGAVYIALYNEKHKKSTIHPTR